jgi:all-trans-retinol 13,14-reductase
VEAPIVVSNADALETYERLLPPAVVDPGQLAALRRLRPSYPCYLTHVGLAGVPPDVLDAAQGYYWNTWDADDLGRGALRFKIFCPTHYEPGLAPPGRQIVILQKVLEIDYDGIEDWTAHKLEIERYLVAGLESVVAGISEHIVTVSTASAYTSWRFTRNRMGAMLGWEMSPDQLGDERPDVFTAVAGLYLAGHWTRPGGGITPVIVSAMRVAEAVTGIRSMPSKPRVTPAELLSAPYSALSEMAVS